MQQGYFYKGNQPEKWQRQLGSLPNQPPSKIRSNNKENNTSPQPGRPIKLTQRTKTVLIRHYNVGDLKTYKDDQRFVESTEGKQIHLATVRQNLLQEGFKTYSQLKKQKLNWDQIARKLQFAKDYIHWTVDDWKRVMFSDETIISRVGSFCKSYYHCRPSHREHHHHQVKPTSQGGGGGKMMVWGCITLFGVGDSGWLQYKVNSDAYLDVVKEYVLASRDFYGMDASTFIYQQDNTRVHTACKVMDYFAKKNITVLPWPGNSPDLNSIEHVWAHMKRELDRYPEAPKTMKELWRRVQDIWTAIPNDFLQKLYESMPRQLEAVIKSKGRNTKY